MKIWAVIKLVITVWVFFWSVFHDDDVWIFPCVSLGELVQQLSATFVLGSVERATPSYLPGYRNNVVCLFVCLLCV